MIFKENFWSFSRSILKWVIPEIIHTPPTDGKLEIQVGGGSRGSGNLGGRGVKRVWKSRWEGGQEGLEIQVGGGQEGLEIQVGRGGGVQARKFFFRGHF